MDCFSIVSTFNPSKTKYKILSKIFYSKIRSQTCIVSYRFYFKSKPVLHFKGANFGVGLFMSLPALKWGRKSLKKSLWHAFSLGSRHLLFPQSFPPLPSRMLWLRLFWSMSSTYTGYKYHSQTQPKPRLLFKT